VEIIFALQDYCTGKEKQCFFNVFPKILHALYELDLVQEDAIWKWVDESKEDSSSKIFIKLCEEFLEWLRTAEEEEDDDDNKEQEENN